MKHMMAGCFGHFFFELVIRQTDGTAPVIWVIGWVVLYYLQFLLDVGLPAPDMALVLDPLATSDPPQYNDPCERIGEHLIIEINPDGEHDPIHGIEPHLGDLLPKWPLLIGDRHIHLHHTHNHQYNSTRFPQPQNELFCLFVGVGNA